MTRFTATAFEVRDLDQPNSFSSGTNMIEVVDLNAAAAIRVMNVIAATIQARCNLGFWIWLELMSSA
jgi:hypothetical protein